MKPSDFNYDEMLNCMRCGFCLPTCPTYNQIGQEAASPRGRIALMKAAADGLLTTEEIAEQMDICLGCRNCESVCPSGVKFGNLLEDAREAVAQEQPRSLIKRVFFDFVFAKPGAMKALGALLWVYQASGLQWLAHKTGLARIVPDHLREMDASLPKVRAPWARGRAPITPARGDRRARVGMFAGCVMDVVFWETNQSTIELLAAAGCEVLLVEGQGCCGALHAHSGEKSGARELAKKNIEAFGKLDLDWVVNAAGGCGAALKEYGHWFHGDAQWGEPARAFARRVRDVSEVLDELGLNLGGGCSHESVTIQESCHLAHAQGVRSQPRRLLKGAPGVALTEMAAPDRCCGSAGIYNITRPELSRRILDEKMEQVKATGAETVVTCNPGCFMQMQLGVRRAGLQDRVRVVHLVDVLHERLGR